MIAVQSMVTFQVGYSFQWVYQANHSYFGLSETKRNADKIIEQNDY